MNLDLGEQSAASEKHATSESPCDWPVTDTRRRPSRLPATPPMLQVRPAGLARRLAKGKRVIEPRATSPSPGGSPRCSSGRRASSRRCETPTGRSWRRWSSCRRECPAPSPSPGPQGPSPTRPDSPRTSPPPTPIRSPACHTAPRYSAPSAPPADCCGYCSGCTKRSRSTPGHCPPVG